MSEVKRYDHMGMHHEFGMYVRWVDYDALAAELEAVRRIVDDVRLNPTWQCPNCGCIDEFSVQHCAPDDVGAVYPVVECHACGDKTRDYRGEDARVAALSAGNAGEK